MTTQVDRPARRLRMNADQATLLLVCVLALFGLAGVIGMAGL